MRRYRYYIMLLLTMLANTAWGQTASVTGYYWFDNDFTTKRTVATTNGVTTLDISKLKIGIHAVHYQTKDANGVPSSVRTRYFYVDQIQIGTLSALISIDDGEETEYELSSEDIVIDVSGLSIGIHELNTKLIDSNGRVLGEDTQEFEIPIPTESITLAKATGGTYCPGMDLDFSDVSGLKAYIAVGFNPEEGVVWIMRVNYVPANEGIMIKGTPGTYDVPYSQTSFHYNNLLVGSHDKRTLPVEEDGYYNYVLKNGLFCPSDGSASVGVNKAYLRIPTSWVASSPSLGRELMIEDIDDPTGITNVQNNADSRVRCYNLNGQRIEHPQKGLYIRNGKKVMIR